MLGRKNDTKQGHFDWKIIGCLLHTFFDDLCKKAFPDILTLSLHERVFAAETYKCSPCEKTFKIKSVLQTHISYIAKRHFPIYLLWHCIKECMQETPYNFLIEVSLLGIILPSKQKSGYYVLLLFHPKVSFQCIIMPSKTKESLHYISILYIKRVLVLSQQSIQKE